MEAEQQYKTPECRVCWIRARFGKEEITVGDQLFAIAEIAERYRIRLRKAVEMMFTSKEGLPFWEEVFNADGVIQPEDVMITSSIGEGSLALLQQDEDFRAYIRHIINQPALPRSTLESNQRRDQ